MSIFIFILDNPDKDTSCTIWKVLFGVTIGLFVLVVLGGVAHEKCPVFKRGGGVPQVGDTGPRIGNARGTGKNCVPNGYTVENGNNRSISQIDHGSPRIDNVHRNGENCVPNGYAVENANGPVPQIGDGSLRIANAHPSGENCVPNGYTVGNDNDRSISQIGDGSPRIGNAGYSEGSCVATVEINAGKASGYRYGEDTENRIAGDYRADNGNVAKDNFLTERGKKCKYLTSEL